MKTINNIEKMETDQISLTRRIVFRPFLVKIGVILLFVLVYFSSEAQIKVPNMLIGNDTWGLIDVNNLYGGCMQVDTYADMLRTDVQFLKRGMLFVVYDNDLGTPGAQTKIYIFSPPKVSSTSVWPYNSPFQIPSADQNNTISLAGLQTYLYPLNISPNTDPGNKMNVYYDSTTFQFYKYDESTDPATYVIIKPKAEFVTVVPNTVALPKNIDSDNVQAALEELADYKEYTIASDGEATVTLLFNLKAGSQIFYNGSLLTSGQWSGVGTKTLTLALNTMTYDKVRIQR